MSPPQSIVADSSVSHWKRSIGAFEYVVHAGWGENPWIGTYSVKVYRSVKDGDYIDGRIARRSGHISAVFEADLDADGLPELMVCFSSGQGHFGDIHIYRVNADGFLELAYQDVINWYVSVENYGGRDHFHVDNGTLYRSFGVSGSEVDTDSEVTTRTLRLRFPEGLWESVDP
jgi:hypothetical protein